MAVEFNSNTKLLMGGSFSGNTSWDKLSSSVDNCYKLYHVRKGKISISDAEFTSDLHEGKLYFINGYKLKSQKCLEDFEVDWIHFFPESLYFTYILKMMPCVQELACDEFASFSACFQKLAPFFEKRLDENESRFVQLEIQALACFTIAKIYRKTGHFVIREYENLQRVLPALEFIAENYTQNISLESLSQECNLSPNYFHRIFTGVFDVSPLNYIRNLRMDEAIRQLVYTSQPVKSIAYNVGYEDEAYFSRVFSKMFETSPGAYRKRFKHIIP